MLKRKPRSIRSKITIAATSVSAVAMLAILSLTAFMTQAIMTQSITNTLNSHLDIVQTELESGNTNIAIQGSGAELIQVIDSSGEVIASSTWAEGLQPISPGGLEPGENRENETETTDTPLAGDPSDTQDNPDEGPVSGPSGGADSSLGDIGSLDESQDSQLGDVGSFNEEQDSELGDVGSFNEGGDSELGDVGAVEDDPILNGGQENPSSDAPKPATGDGPTQGAQGDDELSIEGQGPTNLVLDDSADEMGILGAVASLMGFESQPAHATQPLGNDGLPSAINTSILGQNGPYLTLERGIDTPEGAVTLAAMTSLSQANEAARIVALILGAITLLSLVGIGGASWLLAAKTLQPVEEMRLRVDAIGAGDLSARIPVPENDADLSKLAQTFNRMLSRVEAAMLEQKRFISDASHELKSPVAATRIMLEAAKEHPDAIKSAKLTEDLRAENERMGGIVGNLLLLAQQDEGMPRIEKHPIDLMDLLYEEASSLKARSSVRVDASAVHPVVCNADSTAIRHAVRNLVDNAAKYAESTVKISCFSKGDWVRIVVSDDGPGIPPADRERVFDRFVRLEEGRSRKKGSTGLGLSVVKTIAEQHGGTAKFVDGELGGATAVLTIQA